MNSLAVVVLIAAGLLVFASIYSRRDFMLYKLRWLVISVLFGIGTWGILRTSKPPDAAAAWGFIASLFVFALRPGQPRSMRASERRRAIARYELRTGKKFNPRTHEVDHIIPFARGGNETRDNLRVVTRRINRSKGAKSPWWDVLGRR